MYHHMDGWGWLWAIPMMVLWIAVIGGVVYAVMRLALQHERKPPVSH